MLSWFMRKQIDAFGRRWSYDTSYMRAVLEQAGPGAVMPLNGLGKVGAYRRDVPAGVYYAAKVTASVAADCGPCAQLVVQMAEDAGVSAGVLRALVAGEFDALPPDERLGAELARATLAREPGTETRDAIVARWGYRGLVSIAYGIVAAQAYPTLKYALGAATSCVRLRVAGAEVGASHPVAI
jgi:hypothetical protein